MEITKRILIVWNKIHERLSLLETYPECPDIDLLLSPATEENIIHLESTIHIKIPEEYRLSLKIHEGTSFYVPD